MNKQVRVHICIYLICVYIYIFRFLLILIHYIALHDMTLQHIIAIPRRNHNITYTYIYNHLFLDIYRYTMIYIYIIIQIRCTWDNRAIGKNLMQSPWDHIYPCPSEKTEEDSPRFSLVPRPCFIYSNLLEPIGGREAFLVI